MYQISIFQIWIVERLKTTSDKSYGMQWPIKRLSVNENVLCHAIGFESRTISPVVGDNDALSSIFIVQNQKLYH